MAKHKYAKLDSGASKSGSLSSTFLKAQFKGQNSVVNRCIKVWDDPGSPEGGCTVKIYVQYLYDSIRTCKAHDNWNFYHDYLFPYSILSKKQSLQNNTKTLPYTAFFTNNPFF